MTTLGVTTRDPDRPEYMATLGLLPPYTLDDVHEAYREKAKTTHPDHGGTDADFRKLHEAYEQAQAYVRFHVDRRQWLAARVERYAEQETVANEVRRLGGAIEVEQFDWIKRSFGDFAVVTEMLRGIRLRGTADGDAFLQFLTDHATALEYLLRLDISGSRISDQGVLRLRAIKSLHRLDLSRTPISTAALQTVADLPDLRWLNVAGTSIGWWSRFRLRRLFPRLRLVTKFVP